jgi:hypothetical protein
MKFMKDFIGYLAQGVGINSSYYKLEEIKSGKTTNKIWLTLNQFFFNYLSISVLSEVFPNNDFYFSCLQYAINGLIMISNYLCYVFESNEIAAQNQSQKTLKTLPFGLQNNLILKNIAKFISNNINLLSLGIYLLALSLGIYYGLSQLVFFNLLGVVIEQLYQRNIFHRYIASAYRIFQNLLMAGLLFGFDNWFYIAINLFNLVFMLGDYLLTHVLGITTASALFPIARKSNQLFLDNYKHREKTGLQILLDLIKDIPVEVTFDHMRQGALIHEKLSLDIPTTDYNEYQTLFSKINFNDPEIQVLIEAEITANDDFMRSELKDHIKNLGLHEKASCYEIKVAYLKQEMKWMVERLQSNVPRNLNHEQIAILKGHGRHILEHIKRLNPNRNKQFSLILIELSLRTGSHCSRMYLECFSEIMRNQHLTPFKQLDLKEQVILKMHSLRSDKFSKYYHEMTSLIKQGVNKTNNFFGKTMVNTLWSDTNDYHTYEDFCISIGSNLYLDNPTLSIRFRDLSNIAMDIYLIFILSLHHKNLLFSTHYTSNFLIDELISGKLAPEFQKWCNSLYPNAYQDFCIDEYAMVDKFNPYTRALATLMLLDSNILQFKKPIRADQGFYERCCEKYHGMFEKMIDKLVLSQKVV